MQKNFGVNAENLKIVYNNEKKKNRILVKKNKRIKKQTRGIRKNERII